MCISLNDTTNLTESHQISHILPSTTAPDMTSLAPSVWLQIEIEYPYFVFVILDWLDNFLILCAISFLGKTPHYISTYSMRTVSCRRRSSSQSSELVAYLKNVLTLNYQISCGRSDRPPLHPHRIFITTCFRSTVICIWILHKSALNGSSRQRVEYFGHGLTQDH